MFKYVLLAPGRRGEHPIPFTTNLAAGRATDVQNFRRTSDKADGCSTFLFFGNTREGCGALSINFSAFFETYKIDTRRRHTLASRRDTFAICEAAARYIFTQHPHSCACGATFSSVLRLLLSPSYIDSSTNIIGHFRSHLIISCFYERGATRAFSFVPYPWMVTSPYVDARGTPCSKSSTRLRQ